MKDRFLFVTLMAFIMLQTITVYANNHSFKERLDVISNFAGEICQTVPTDSSTKEVRLAAGVEAGLPKLLKKLADLGLDIEYSQETSFTSGVPQEDLKEVIVDSNQCRLKLAEVLIGWLITTSPRIHDSPGVEMHDRDRENKIELVLSILDRISLNDRYTYLAKNIPRIKYGVTCGEFVIMVQKIPLNSRHTLIIESASYIKSITIGCFNTLVDLVEFNHRMLVIDALGM